MHEDRAVLCIFECIGIDLIRFQVIDTLCPYFFRFTHGYPYICINDISIPGCFRNTVCQCDGCSCRGGHVHTVIHELLVRIIFRIGAGNKMHAKLCAGNHQGIAHIVTGIPHVYKLHTLKFSKMLLDGKHIGNHLCRMGFIGQSVPHRNPCIFCQFFHNLLSESAIFDSIKHTSQNTCGIRNTFLFSNLGTARIKICHMHTQIMCGYLERASGSCTCLLENQCNIFSNQTVMHDSLMFLLFQLCGQIHKIQDLLRCKIHHF